MKVTVGKLRIVKAIVDQCKTSKSPFGYACLRSSERIASALKKHTEAHESMLHELASLNEDKSYKLNEKGGLVFTKQNQDKINEFWKKQNEEEVEYDPYIATSIGAVKDDLPLLDALNGIVVNVDIESLYNSLE
jgi:hypothetical protein